MLLAGPWLYPSYQQACADALQQLGWSIRCFSWSADFYRQASEAGHLVHRSLLARIQARLLVGPLVARVNRRLLDTARAQPPDVVWLYNCPPIHARTVRALRATAPSAMLVQYCNDNPFGSHVRPDYWRHLKASIPEFHRHFVYRESNRAEFLAAGARWVDLLRSYYVPEVDRPVTLGPEDSRYDVDVVFAGHYEKDGRLESLRAVAAAGYRLNVFGEVWHEAPPAHVAALTGGAPIRAIYGDVYRKAICGARIALSFLSKRNRDTYTRRSFEIPAMGAFLLSEYSDDLASLFEEGREAEFFRSPDELLEKIRFYLARPQLRQTIADRGRARVIADGHDVCSRMKQFQSALERH